MRPRIEQSKALAPLSPFRSWLDCTTNTSGYDFRKGRLIGSIRRECIDHFVVLSEAHLRLLLRAYARFYNAIRTHRSLDKYTPVSCPVQRTGAIS